MKKETVKTTKKAPVAPKKKVLYAINNANPDDVSTDGIYIYDTLEEAYNNHILDMGTNEPAHVYRVEYMGKASMQLTIKP